MLISNRVVILLCCEVVIVRVLRCYGGVVSCCANIELTCYVVALICKCVVIIKTLCCCVVLLWRFVVASLRWCVLSRYCYDKWCYVVLV